MTPPPSPASSDPRDAAIRVRAPSRLHFGMYAPAATSGRRYGGVGVMIEPPGLELWLEPAERLAAEGPLAERALRFAARWSEAQGVAPPRRRLTIAAAPPEHAGLGLGTQLGMAVAAGLSAAEGFAPQGALELARSVGRGERSAVGAWGFVLGGLIAERGKAPGEVLAPLDARLDLPTAWRFVLVRPRGAAGAAGAAEQQAFSRLPETPAATTARLEEEARLRLLPAAASGDFAAFAESLHRFGRDAGGCFAAVQGGPYASPRAAALVERIRGWGWEGVGQSSWGPTLFVAAADADSAARLVRRLAESPEGAELDLRVAGVANQGAEVRAFPARGAAGQSAAPSA